MDLPLWIEAYRRSVQRPNIPRVVKSKTQNNRKEIHLINNIYKINDLLYLCLLILARKKQKETILP